MIKDWNDLSFWSSDAFMEVTEFLSTRARLNKVVTPIDYFRVFDETPYDQAKVLIMGQDPYPYSGYADGLAFSTKGVLPPSLENIFTELENDGYPRRRNPDLTDWARQGVMLLNTQLTTDEGKVEAHKGYWDPLIAEVCNELSKKSVLSVMLWGKWSWDYSKFFDPDKHLIVESYHPSPRSAHRGFFGTHPFSKTNQYLIDRKVSPIVWVPQPKEVRVG